MNWIWPKIYGKTTAIDAGKGAAWAAFFVAGVTGLFALLSIFELSDLVSPWALIDAGLVSCI
jgi:hypothetical protein